MSRARGLLIAGLVSSALGACSLDLDRLRLPSDVDAGDALRDAPGLDAPREDAPGLDAPGLDAPGLDALAPDDTGSDAGFTFASFAMRGALGRRAVGRLVTGSEGEQTWLASFGRSTEVFELSTSGCSMTASPAIPIADGGADEVVADLDGDGDLDAMGVDGVSVWIARSDGLGTAIPTMTAFMHGLTNPAALVTADFDGDGRRDVVLGAGPDRVLFLLEPTDTWTQQGTLVGPVGAEILDLGVADWNGDMVRDVIVLRTETARGSFLVVSSGDGSAGFLDDAAQPVGNADELLVTDGLIVAFDDDEVFLSEPDLGTMGRTTRDSALDDAIIADLDGNGRPELVTVSVAHEHLDVYDVTGGSLTFLAGTTVTGLAADSVALVSVPRRGARGEVVLLRTPSDLHVYGLCP